MQIKGKTLEVPLIQGGMGIGVSLGGLAGAVAACGAMGIISIANPGYLEDDFWENPLEANIRALKKEIIKAKKIAKGKGLIGINAMVASSQYKQMIKVALENGIDCIISGAGLPTELPALTKCKDVLLSPIVSSGKAAKVICNAWDRRHQCTPDFIVIEGSDAGGHLGFAVEELINHTAKNLKEILQDVLKTLIPFEEKYGHKIPVFVAGGLDNAKDIEEIMEAGASGVQIATPFITTTECDASEAYKKLFLTSQKKDIVITKSPVGMPGRAFLTPLIQKIQNGERVAPKKCVRCIGHCDPKTIPYCITKALIEGVKGNYEEGLFFCGSNAYHLKNIVSVQERIHELMPKFTEVTK